MKLNIGCGLDIRPGYTNIDIIPGSGVDVVADLRHGIPVPDNAADEVLAQNFVEHLSDSNGVYVMNEIWRVLKPGGIAIIIIPHTGGPAAFCDLIHVLYWNRLPFNSSYGDSIRFMRPSKPYSISAEFMVLEEEKTDARFRFVLRAVKDTHTSHTTQPTVICATPYSTDGNLGVAYNQFMELLPDGGWAILTDHDMMWTTYNWYPRIVRAIAERPDAVFSVIASRGVHPVTMPGNAPPGDDIADHRAFGAERDYALRDATGLLLTGVVMVLSKRTWKAVGGFKEDGILSVDTDFFRKLKDHRIPVLIMDGVYVYHWFRGGVRANLDHLRPVTAPQKSKPAPSGIVASFRL